MQADTAQERAIPSRYMLENVLTSFEDLVEARIRAYGQILSNHVHGLREAQPQGAAAFSSAASSALLASNPQSSHNARGALIADSKLRTFLDIATKDALFTSITTQFEVLQEISEDDGDDDATTSTTSTSAMNDEDERTHNHIVSLPIEMTVEITSENLPLLQQQYHGYHHHHHYKQAQQKKDETTTRTTQKKIIIFKIQGRIQASLFPIGSSNDISIEDEKYDSCHISPNNTSDGQQLVEIGTNSTAVSPTVSPLFEFEAITLDIDCEALLKQMIEEASTVVSLAVEHTNRTWKNNTKMQHELDTTLSSLAVAAAAVAAGPLRPAMGIAAAPPAPAPSSSHANVIADDHEELYVPPETGRRPRSDSIDDLIMGPPGSNVHFVRQELGSSFCASSTLSSLASLPAVTEEDDGGEEDEHDHPHQTFPPMMMMKRTLSFTNLAVVHRDNKERKKRKSSAPQEYQYQRDFVSLDHQSTGETEDVSTTFSESRNPKEGEHEDFTKTINEHDDDDEAADYNNACNIVDFVFAGEGMDQFVAPPHDVLCSCVSSVSNNNKRLRVE